MKKMTVLAACILLSSSPAFAAEQTDNESTRLNSQEEATVQYQAQVDTEEGTPAMLQAMQRYQFKHENTMRIRNMIHEAKQQGLPTTPMVGKVHEGIAKRISEENIVQAVKRVQNRYEHAYRQASTLTMDKQQAKQLGQIIADAYTAGLKEEDGARIMTQLQTKTKSTNRQETKELMVQTMITARIMARLGVDSTTTSALLVNAIRNSYQAREMHTLQNSFIEQARYGSPEDVASEFSTDINQGIAASNLGGRSNASGSGDAGSSSGSSSSSSGGSSSSSSGSSGSSGGSSGSSGGSSGGSGGSSGSSGGSSGSSGGSSGSSGGSSGSSGGSSGGSGGR